MQHDPDAGPGVQHPDRFDLSLEATVGEGDVFGFHTADGVASRDAFRESELALLEVLADDPPETLLVARANYGVVGVVMATFADRVRQMERSARAARLCRLNASANRVDDATATAVAADPRTLPGPGEAVALAPRAYEPAVVVEQRIVDALAMLPAGGDLYLAARPDTGLSRYERALRDQCATTSTVRTVGDVSVLHGSRPTGYDPPQFVEPRRLEPTIDGTDLSLVTVPGLFSASALDEGTRRLAARVDVEDGESILDLACGYGPLGIYAARTADCTVHLTDDDVVAANCARRSASLSGVAASVDVTTGDGVAAVRNRRFDRILCNPPTHAGAGVLDELMRGARDVLAPAGRLHLVHHRGVDFDRYLDGRFERSATVASGPYQLVTAVAE